MEAYYDEEDECLVFFLEDPILFWVALWLDDYWCDCWSGFVWWPLAAIG